MSPIRFEIHSYVIEIRQRHSLSISLCISNQVKTVDRNQNGNRQLTTWQIIIIIIIIINFSEKGNTKGLYKVIPNTQHKYGYM